MAYVQVDVDMSDLDTDDLVEEISNRLRRDGHRKSLSVDQKKKIKQLYSELADALNVTTDAEIIVKTLDDKIKYEHIARIFTKYNSSQLQNILPE